MEDQQLVRRVLDGNRNAFLELIDRYKLLVAHMIGRVVDNDLDKEELCQDVFIKIYESLGSFRFNSKLSTWIATISYRMAINFAKKNVKKNQEQELDKIAFKISVDDHSFEKEDFKQFIHDVVSQMPESYRVVLTLFYLDEFSYPEIVEITGMPEGTVKNYLFRARQKMKDLITPYVGKEIEI
ncbi:MAG: RNA polymerase sigma factor (sigma-70 family) [Cyclobacteriaceae bacterium]|jgi:RNA polymerase sigma factor (sigma-70 family)